ncbi:MAG: methyltransferase [Chitinophagales bacterium]|nr:methyltransferase [Chitinophagales bacterium]
MSKDKSQFHFKKFSVYHQNATMKVGTDGTLIGAWAFKDVSPKYIVDVGTGSGLIALMLAQRFGDADILGIDIHEGSIQDALYNKSNFPLNHHLDFACKDFESIVLEKLPDAIISNPPYFSSALLSDRDDKNRARHQVYLTMDSLVKKATSLLNKEGRLALILPFSEMQIAIEFAAQYHWFPARKCFVYSTEGQLPVRMMVEFAKESSVCYDEHLVIYHPDRTYTEAYKNLTKDFYLKF